MTKDYQQIWKDITNNPNDEAKAIRTLAEILTDKEGRDFISHLDRKDAELCIEILDQGLEEQDLKPTEKQTFFVALRRLAGHHGRLPDSMIITEKIDVSDEMFASSGFAEVRSGTYSGHLVAVKTMRVAEQDNLLKIRKHFCKELVLWNTLSHPNVMELAGVVGDMDKGQFITVSEWMAHGNIMEFIKVNQVNRLELLHGAARGLRYLHDARLVHGDLKGANILMTNDLPPRACLADFGFMTMVLNPCHPMASSAHLEGGTMTFMAPELLAPSEYGIEVSGPTPETDIYAFGLVIFQVLTGEIPFRGIRQTELGYSAVHGMRPEKPANASAIGFSESMWRFVQRCWDGKVELRPRVGRVVAQLGEAAVSWGGLMPPSAQPEHATSNSVERMSYGNSQTPLSAVLEVPTESQTAPGTPSRLSTPSSRSTELPLDETQGAVTSKLPEEVYPHLDQRHNPPPTTLPKRKRKGIKYIGSKVYGFVFGR